MPEKKKFSLIDKKRVTKKQTEASKKSTLR
jgi:hypothetical protein